MKQRTILKFYDYVKQVNRYFFYIWFWKASADALYLVFIPKFIDVIVPEL